MASYRAGVLTRRFRPALPVDLRQTLAPLWVGRPDPTMRLGRTEALRASWTPEGAATLRLEVDDGACTATAWGPGASWALDQAPALVGATDSLDGLVAHDRLVARALKARPGLRIGASGRVADVLVPIVLAQKVTGLEAARSWIGMLRAWGEPAPGPHHLSLPPRPEVIAGQPTWAFARLGVERRRAETIQLACRRIDRLEEAAGMSPTEAEERLTALPGLGPWTSALIRRAAFGDADAVEVGDFHIPNMIAWALAGEPRGDDGRMLELLAPYAGHRGRVVRLLGSVGTRAPAYGPRLSPRDLRTGAPRR